MKRDNFIKILKERVLLLDGAMGTMIQQLNLKESDFRGEGFLDHPVNLQGCNDILAITSPSAIESIHKKYLEAGADIISTDSFNATSVSLADYGLEKYPGLIKRINCEAARIARNAAEQYGAREWRRALVAGSIGPTNRTTSMSPDVNDPAMRNLDYDTLFDAYSEQIEGLIEGGVDILLFETVFDTLNLKAGLDAANHVMAQMDVELPVMISVTLSDKSARTLSGQTLEAFVTSIEDYANVVSIGLNCGFGPEDMLPHLRELGNLTSHYVSAHPNAGLPDAMGKYKETPEIFSGHVGKMLREGLLNIAGGCCGTTPEHIHALRQIIDAGAAPHTPRELKKALRISGLERLEVLPENNFVNVGERCNVAGSRKFLRLIKEKNYEEALKIARNQVEAGAMVIDINMDDAMLDARAEMVHFLRYIASDPEVARVPVMVDSSDWNVVEAALKNLQGKSIVNSISLKEGEESFIRKAKRIRELGAAVIVMAFDEEGQADTYIRKIEISQRAYRILTEKCGFLPDDIIFDVNVMAIATGIEEHNLYALDFIKGVEWIKGNLPGARTSGGVSNLSFAFRGKNSLREAIHAVFLYHAISKGLDMGIVNPATTVTYDDIEPSLRDLIEDVILARRPEAPEELAAIAANEVPAAKNAVEAATEPDRSIPVKDRLLHSIVKGDAEFLKENLEEALEEYCSAVKIIDGPLMEGMNRVGELFGEGKMFLPQVVKTARTMKMAVDILRPYIEQHKESADSRKAGKVVFATVKGDVHDIGKNIVSIVMECNNFEVIDLGVMVPSEKIVATVMEERPDFLFLSGLITPSLSEMVNVAKAMAEKGLDIPIIVGGATTSELHTALKIAPQYSGIVIHAGDASQNPLISAKLLNPVEKEKFELSLKKRYDSLIADYEAGGSELEPFDKISGNAGNRESSAGGRYVAKVPAIKLEAPHILNFDLQEVSQLINWKMFFHAWKLEGDFLKDFPYDGCDGCNSRWLASLQGERRAKGEEALKIYRDALNLLAEINRSGIYDGKGMVAFYPAYSDRDDVVIGDLRFPTLRQQKKGTPHLSVADFISQKGVEDYVGLFAVTSGNAIARLADKYKAEGDDYTSLLCGTLSDRLAEASSELLHYKVRTELWGYNPGEEFDPHNLLRGEYPGIRPAMGYPMLPDQLLNLELNRLLPVEKIGVRFTENGAMIPQSSVSGLYISNPEARYFMVGTVGEDQLQDYSRRRNLPLGRLKELLR